MISVIIPIYNAAERLPVILRCLYEQSEKDYEILLVNDGSTDASGNICDAAAKNDKRIRVLHQENSGVSAARNLGLREAHGEYIAFLDADDEIPPEYLSVLLDACENNDCDAAICDVVIINNDVEIGRFTHPGAVLGPRTVLDLLLSRKKVNSGPSGKVFNKKLFRTAAFPPLRAYEDILLVKDVFSLAEKIAVTDKTEYRYIQNNEGAMKKFSKAPSTDIIVATDELMKFIKLRRDLSPECMYITLSHLMQYVLPLLKSKNEQSKDFIQKSRKLYRKYIFSILRCSAFPWKEKIVFSLFAFGFSYKKN